MVLDLLQLALISLKFYFLVDFLRFNCAGCVCVVSPFLVTWKLGISRQEMILGISYFSDIVTKHYDQKELTKESLFRLRVGKGMSLLWQGAWQQGSSGQGAWQQATGRALGTGN